MALLLSLVAAELLLRALGMQRYGRRLPGEPHPTVQAAAYIEADPSLGWVSNRGMPGINPQGFRDPHDLARLDRDASRKRVMILGDSLMWGVGVDSLDTVPALLQARLGQGFEVFNLAVPGWGIDQMYLAYAMYREVVKPDYIIVAFIDPDIDRVLEAYRPWEGLTKPCLRVQDGRIVTRTGSTAWERLSNKVLWRSVLGGNLLRHIFLATDAVPLVRAIFAELAANGEEEGYRCAILRIPLRGQGLRRRPAHLRVHQFPGSERVTYLEGSQAMERAGGAVDRFYLDEGHLSPAGNRLIAGYLAHEIFDSSWAAEGP